MHVLSIESYPIPQSAATHGTRREASGHGMAYVNGEPFAGDPYGNGYLKVPIALKQGANTLLVKITQGGGEWSVCCRVRAPDGKGLEGITVAPGEQ